MHIAYLALAALVGFFAVRVFRDLERPVRRRALRWALSAVLFAVLLFVMARFGFHWLAIIALAAGALLRRALPPLLRMLPWALQIWARKTHAEPGPSTGHAPSGARAAGRMSRKEALDVLGLEEGATREEILASYKQLIKKVHPDTPGGSNYLASKINQAKNVLIP